MTQVNCDEREYKIIMIDSCFILNNKQIKSPFSKSMSAMYFSTSSPIESIVYFCYSDGMYC